MTLVIGVNSHEGEHGQIDNIGRYGQGMTRNPMETTTKSVKPKAQEEMPESEIRMGYGILYQAYGKLLHGLNKFHLVVGLELPKFKFHLDRPIIHFNDYQEHCKNLAVVDYIWSYALKSGHYICTIDIRKFGFNTKSKKNYVQISLLC